MTTSLTSGMPRREIWWYFPLTPRRSVVDHMPMIGFFLELPFLARFHLPHLQRDRVHAEAGQGVVADLRQVPAVQQVEDAQVGEERVVGLPGERAALNPSL